MRKKLALLALSLSLISLNGITPVSPAAAAPRGGARRVTILRSCRYSGGPRRRRSTVYAYAATVEAKAVIEKILEHTGIARNFEVEAADVDNAEAGVDGNNRPYIWYNRDFMDRIVRAARTDWARTSILAHEIAHLLMNHTFTETEPSHTLELQADRYSGHILRMMGASPAEAQAAVAADASKDGSDSHPPKQLRLAAIREGWDAADAKLRNLVAAMSGRPAPRQTTGQPPTAQSPRPSEETHHPAPQPSRPEQGIRPVAPQSDRRTFRISAGNTARHVGQNWWVWTVFLSAPEEALARIRCVEYTLHPTFRPNVVSVCDRGTGPAFGLTRKGWGTFGVGVRVITKDNRVISLSHDLRFK